jgi:aryl-alcohol dehydrogenase-like predicted oxidoreductase
MGIPDYLSHEDRNSQAFRSAGAAFPDLDTAQLTRLAIRFVLSTPEVDCCVVGMRTPAEVAANVELAEDVAGRLDIRSLHNRFA